MHQQDIAIVKALIPVAWADGVFADREKEMLDALLDAYGATDKEKEIIHEYAEKRRTIDDIDLQELSADDRRVLLQHAVLLTFADGAYLSFNVSGVLVNQARSVFADHHWIDN